MVGRKRAYHSCWSRLGLYGSEWSLSMQPCLHNLIPHLINLKCEDGGSIFLWNVSICLQHYIPVILSNGSRLIMFYCNHFILIITFCVSVGSIELCLQVCQYFHPFVVFNLYAAEPVMWQIQCGILVTPVISTDVIIRKVYVFQINFLNVLRLSGYILLLSWSLWAWTEIALLLFIPAVEEFRNCCILGIPYTVYHVT
jgi:hypothetical protein